MVCDCPTMPKRGVCVSTTRRSISSSWPVISACSGAAKPSAAASAGTSCTRPSVIMMAPATRSGGTSASVEDSAENSRVPSVSPSASPASATRTSRPGMRLSRSTSVARAASVCGIAVAEILARALVDDDGGDRGDRVAILARQRRIGERQHHQRQRHGAHRRAAAARQQQQRRDQHGARRTPPRRHSRAPAERMRRRSSNQAPTVPAARAAPGYAPGRLCSCRSARTSRC